MRVWRYFCKDFCLDSFQQMDTITLQHVDTVLRGTKHRDEAIVVITEGSTNIQQASKRLKQLLQINKRIVGKRYPLRRELFQWRGGQSLSH